MSITVPVTSILHMSNHGKIQRSKSGGAKKREPRKRELEQTGSDAKQMKLVFRVMLDSTHERLEVGVPEVQTQRYSDWK